MRKIAILSEREEEMLVAPLLLHGRRWGGEDVLCMGVEDHRASGSDDEPYEDVAPVFVGGVGEGEQDGSDDHADVSGQYQPLGIDVSSERSGETGDECSTAHGDPVIVCMRTLWHSETIYQELTCAEHI